MKKFLSLLFLVSFLLFHETVAQNNALLEVESTNQGVLIPMMNSAQRLSIPVGAGDVGLMVYDTDSDAFMSYDGSAWQTMSTQWKDYTSGIQYNQGSVSIGNAVSSAERLYVHGDARIADSLRSGSSKVIIHEDFYSPYFGESFAAGTISMFDSHYVLDFPFPTNDLEKKIEFRARETMPLGANSGKPDPIFIMYNRNENEGIKLDFNSGGRIRLYDELGNTRMSMDSHPSTTGSDLKLYNANNTNTILIGSSGSADAPFIQLKDNTGNIKINIDAETGGDSRITTDELEIKGGSDFAENFDIIPNENSNLTPEPGMLVSIDPKNSGKLMVSFEAFDTKVAGVISGANGIEPGVFMGQEGTIANGNYPIALTGRVYAFATCSNGPISPGDLLTSSAIPGHSMKVKKGQNGQGAIVGKAMTALTKGEGLVLVLVNLH